MHGRAVCLNDWLLCAGFELTRFIGERERERADEEDEGRKERRRRRRVS